LFVKYDCEANIANLGVEWNGGSLTCIVAFMCIHFNDKNREYYWELEQDDINATKVDIGTDGELLGQFSKAVGKNVKFLFSSECYARREKRSLVPWIL